MDELAGGRRRADPPPFELPPDDLLMEILLRLPPEPIHLFRASFVSKHWRSLVHDARFLRRFREFHGGTPPVLGFFNNQRGPPLFVPTSGGFALSTAAKMSTDDWWAFDCRHGRALLEKLGSRTLLVWDLVTGDQCYLRVPPACGGICNGTVLCAADHAHHGGDCHSCPFLVVYVFSRSDSPICACVWSSETGVWTGVRPPPWIYHLYHLFRDRQLCYQGQIVLMPTEDGLLGLAGVEGLNLHLWSLMVSVDGLATWTHQRVIDLKNFLALEVVAGTFNYSVEAIGFAEDAGVIFICARSSVYMIHLKSMQIEEVSQKGDYGSVLPYTSFYAPGITIGGGDDQAEM